MNAIPTPTDARPLAAREWILLRILLFVFFLGRGLQGLFFDLPLRELLWDEAWMGGLIQSLFGLSWEEYVKTSDPTIQGLVWSLGLFWTVCAAVLALASPPFRWVRWLIWVAFVSVVGLSFLYWKEKWWNLGEFLEYSIQMCLPVFLAIALKAPEIANRVFTQRLLAAAVGIAFFSHGLYAFGYYPQPAAWVDWCVYVFQMSEGVARMFLKIMGVLDFMVLPALFLPWRQTRNAALVYAVIWGLLTALARVVSNFSMENIFYALTQSTHDVLFRLPHGGLPLLLLWMYQSAEESSDLLPREAA